MKENRLVQYNLKDDDVLYFLHIPKTAGNTLLNMIDDYFDTNQIFPETGWSSLLAKYPIDLSGYRFFRGHFGYGLHRIMKRKPIYITMLRKPLQQIISAYDQLVLDSTNNQNKELLNLNEFLNNPVNTSIISNQQTRYLSLDIDPTNVSLIDKGGNLFDFSRYSRFCQPSITELEMIEIAKKHLKNFAFFGITERFQESLFLLCYTFGFRPIKNIVNRNITIKKTQLEEINKKNLEQLNQFTRLDQEIYNFAREIFDERFSIMLERLHNKYNESKFDLMVPSEAIFNMLENYYYENFEHREIKDITIDYKFTKRLNGSGWHKREFLPDSGKAFRWTGPDNVSIIDFRIDTSHDIKIKFSIILKAGKDIGDSLKLKVNYMPVSIQKIYHNLDHMIFEGIVEKEILKKNKNYTTLLFEVNRTKQPSPTDDRFIGIALDWIGISPKK